MLVILILMFTFIMLIKLPDLGYKNKRMQYPYFEFSAHVEAHIEAYNKQTK